MTSINEIKKDFYDFMDEKCEEVIGDLVSNELYERVKDDLIVRLVKSVMEDYSDNFNGKKHKSTKESTKESIKSKAEPRKRKKSLNASVSNLGTSFCGFSRCN